MAADLSQFRLARTLQQQAQGERAIEVARELLTDEPTYSAFDAFRVLDPSAKGYVTADDLKEFLRRFGVYANDEDAARLIRRYTSGTDTRAKPGQISYSDFLLKLEPPGSPPVRRKAQSVLANTSIAGATAAAAASPAKSGGAVAAVNASASAAAAALDAPPRADERLLAYKLKTEVEVDRNSRVMRELLSEEVGASLHEAFRRADQTNSGFLGINELTQIMTTNGIFLTTNEFASLMKQYDKNNDGRISYVDFLRELLPDDVGPTIAAIGGSAFPTTTPKQFKVQYEMNADAVAYAREALLFDGATTLATPQNTPAAAQKIYYKSRSGTGGGAPHGLPATFYHSNYDAINSAAGATASTAAANGTAAAPALAAGDEPPQLMAPTPIKPVSPNRIRTPAAKSTRPAVVPFSDSSYRYRTQYNHPFTPSAATAAAPAAVTSPAAYFNSVPQSAPPAAAAPASSAGSSSQLDRKYPSTAAAPPPLASAFAAPLSFEEAVTPTNAGRNAFEDSFSTSFVGTGAANAAAARRDANTSFFGDPTLSPIRGSEPPTAPGSAHKSKKTQTAAPSRVSASPARPNTSVRTHGPVPSYFSPVSTAAPAPRTEYASFVQSLYPLPDTKQAVSYQPVSAYSSPVKGGGRPTVPYSPQPSASSYSYVASGGGSAGVLSGKLLSQGTQTPARYHSNADMTMSRPAVAVAPATSSMIPASPYTGANAANGSRLYGAGALLPATLSASTHLYGGTAFKCAVSYCERVHLHSSSLCALHSQIYPNHDSLESGLVYTLRRQVDSERELEHMRRRLALHPSFNLIDAFTHFDRSRSGYLTSNELDAVLTKAGVRLSGTEIRHLMRLLDHDEDGKISYSDFIRKLMPKDERYSDLVTNRAHPNAASSPVKKLPHAASSSAAGAGGSPNRSRALSGGAARELALTLKRHLDLETELDHLRAVLVARPDFSLPAALRAIDKAGTGTITIQQFRAFLIERGVVPTTTVATAPNGGAAAAAATTATADGEWELSALLSRYDKQNTGSISYLDFLDELVLPSYVTKPAL